MSPLDTAIWTRYLAANAGTIERVWYDFRIGDEDPVPDELPSNIRAAWYDLSYWRIDVIVETNDALYIVEVKPFANSKAVGQALCYAAIYTTDEAPKKRVVPTVLTDVVLPTTQRVADQLGVEVWQA